MSTKLVDILLHKREHEKYFHFLLEMPSVRCYLCATTKEFAMTTDQAQDLVNTIKVFCNGSPNELSCAERIAMAISDDNDEGGSLHHAVWGICFAIEGFTKAYREANKLPPIKEGE